MSQKRSGRVGALWVGIFGVCLLLALPAMSQECGYYDSGEPRPASDPERRVECGAEPEAATPQDQTIVQDPQDGSGALSLTTLFASNNGGAGGGGVYFELENVSALPIEISHWGVNTGTAGTFDVAVYSRPGTYSGFESSPAGWTLMGTDTGVTGNGTDMETPVMVGGLVLLPGETYGIAMGGPTGPAWRYTNGNGSNETYNNGDLELRAGSANNIALSGGTVFSPRVWNGVVYYDAVPVELQKFSIE